MGRGPFGWSRMTTFPAVEAFRGREGLIRVVGHRGARGILPENTLIGFDFTLSTGVSLLEFDVVLTADDVPVITHNHRLHAATFRGPEGAFITSEPKVADLTYEELQRYDVGRSDGRTAYGQRFPDQAQLDGIRVPRLIDLLELVAAPQHAAGHVMLEIKSDPDLAEAPGYRTGVVAHVLDDVRAAGLTERTLLHSFDWALLAECRRQAPDIPASFLTQLPEAEEDDSEDSAQAVAPDFTGRAAQIPDLVLAAGGRLWCPFVEDVTAADVQRAHALGLVVVVWTVNTPAEIAQMIDYGVDAIVTDYPGRVQRALAARGFAWLDAP